MRFSHRSLILTSDLLIACGLIACGGGSAPNCPAGETYDDETEMCVPGPSMDGGSADAGSNPSDASAPRDASACATECSGATPVCDVATGTCVGCLSEADCDAPERCDPSSNRCVDCLEDSECTAADAARCSDGTCVACDADAQCDGISGLGYCGAGTCVECVNDDQCPDAEAAACIGNSCAPCTTSEQCGATRACDTESTPARCVECTRDDATACSAEQTCNLDSQRCENTRAGSREICEPCTNDLQCEADYVCARMNFDGVPVGGYCLPVAASTTCARPFAETEALETYNRDTPVEVCTPDMARTTCSALIASQSYLCEAAGPDGDCTPPGATITISIEGALCRETSSDTWRCTYACDEDADCGTSGSPAGDFDLSSCDTTGNFCTAP